MRGTYGKSKPCKQHFIGVGKGQPFSETVVLVFQSVGQDAEKTKHVCEVAFSAGEDHFLDMPRRVLKKDLTGV